MIIPKLADGCDNLTAAALYANAGVYVLPVKPGTKNPGSRVGMRWQDKSSRDAEQIVAWFAGSSDGIAIDIGRSGLIVIDVDSPDRLPEWLWHNLIQSGAPYQQTRPNSSGRGHYVYLMPKGRRIGNGKGGLAGMGLDIRGAGGAIVVQPTVHPDGGEYKWLTSGEVPDLPQEIADKLTDTEQAESAATDSEVTEFIQSMQGNENPRLLSTWSNKFLSETARLDSRHDAMISVLTAALEESKAGYFPARDAVDVLRELFVSSIIESKDGKRSLSESAAHAEFGGILSWAVGQAKMKSAKKIRAKTEKGISAQSQQDAKIIELLRPEKKPAQAETPGTAESASEATPEAENGTVRLTPASSIASAAPTWAWEYNGAGRIQLGTMVLMGGRPGAGKSTAARWFAAGYSTGRIPGCLFGRPVNVAYIATEESHRYVIRPSLDAAGADTNRILFPSITDDEGNATRLVSASHEVRLAKAFRENDIRVVIVDPIMSTISQNADTHRNNETRLYLEPWSRIAEAIDGIVIGIVHLNKSGNTDLVAAINGSSAFGEVARAVFGFVKDKQGNRIMSQVKNSTGREDLSVTYEIGESLVPTDNGDAATVATFAITGLSDLTAADAMIADAEAGISLGGKQDAAARWLEDYLAMKGLWVRAREVIADARREEDIPRATLYRAAKKLKVIQELRDMPAKSYWRLPDDTLAAALRRLESADTAGGFEADAG
jgi:hypothetical protein